MAHARTGLRLRSIVGAVLAVWCALGSVPAGAQSAAYLVKDIVNQPLPASSSPNGFALVNGRVLFFASTPSDGLELWSTDGTEAGTQQVIDLEPGPESANLANLTPVGNAAYFTRAPAARGGDGAPTFELWKTDGTAAGTVLVDDIAGPRNIRGSADLNGLFVFSVLDSYDRRLTLWRSDGSAGGTRAIAEFTDVPLSDSFSYPLAAVGNVVLFSGWTTRTGFEPWRTDGTRSGTFALGDLVPGPGSSNPQAFTGTPLGAFFVTIDDEGNSSTLWLSDGSSAGTVPVQNNLRITPNLQVLNGVPYFLATSPQMGRGLWTSDGTAAGTHLVASAAGYELAATAQRLFFIDNDAGISRVWSSDGTAGGTTPITGSITPAYVPSFTPGERLVYFTRADVNHDAAFWRSDGTADGTYILRELDPLGGIHFLNTVGDRLFFSGYDAASGDELWTSDGTPDSTALVKNIAADGVLTDSANPTFFTPLGDKLFFIARPLISPDSLWVTDGSTEGTTELLDFGVPPARGPVSQVLPADDRVYVLSAFTLWMTNGDGAPTRINPDSDPIYSIARAGDALYGLSRELCRIDGDAVGPCAPKLVMPREVATASGNLFAVADEGELAGELVVTDLTPQGTHIVAEVAPGSAGSAPSKLTAVGSLLYFVADDLTHGRELWRTDGTAPGTRLVRDVITPEDAQKGVGILQLMAAGDRIFFTVGHEDFSEGETDLWVSDGTMAGTRFLKQLCSDCTYNFELAAVGDRLFFVATDTEHGYELWSSNGTPAGTRRVVDLNPGPLGSNPNHLTPIGDQLFFAACDALGCEPFVSDGTADGTHRLADIAPGAASSAPIAFAQLGSRLLVSATDYIRGDELWAIRLGAGPLCAGDCDGSGRVGVNELVLAVNVALGVQPVASCTPVDSDGSGTVSVAELVAAVGAALNGCAEA